MKLVAGLGNPGPEYDATRHNVGWWVVDRLAYDWEFGAFERSGAALVSEGVREGFDVTLVKPLTYMNRSGAALRPLVSAEGFDTSADLLVVVDDAALDVGRVRFRPSGGAGGHNGLRSVEAVLGTDGFARLRIGVGLRPEGEGMTDWVLSEPDQADEESILSVLPLLSKGIGVWLVEGIEAAMNQYNH